MNLIDLFCFIYLSCIVCFVSLLYSFMYLLLFLFISSTKFTLFVFSFIYAVLRVVFCFFFFFNQKTAYEMRISDWSSDVCSSDLQALSLTIAGERLLEAVAPLIDDLGRIFDSMSGPHELRLRVGVLPLFASHVLMPQLPRLRNLHPELHLDLDTAPLPVSRLGEGLDVALTLAQDIDPRFYSRRIGHNRIAVVASKAMANSSNAPRTPDDLRGHTILVHLSMPHALNH